MNRVCHRLISIAASICCTCAFAQNISKNDETSSQATCLSAADFESQHVHGVWQVRFYDGPLPSDTRQPVNRPPVLEGTLLFEPHAEHAESLRGTFKLRGASATRWMSGDVEQGELILDESDDGQRISAIWVAYPAAGACGREWRGNRRMADDDTLQTLVLTRAGSWR
jgi:hypothetical protein